MVHVPAGDRAKIDNRANMICVKTLSFRNCPCCCRYCCTLLRCCFQAS